MELECGYSPKQSQSYLFLSPPYQHWPGKVAVGNVSLGKNTAVRCSCFLPHSTDIGYKLLHTHTDICTHFPIPRLRRFEPASRTGGSVASAENGCGSAWLPAGAGLLPCCKVCLWFMCFCWGVFPVLTLYSPRSIVWGLFFFLLTFLLLCCNFLQFSVFLSCLPPCHICMLCMGRLMAYFTRYLWPKWQ